MKQKIGMTLLLLLCFNGAFTWGFYGHKLINRMAVFTLPERLLMFYKTNIEYITEHAVDADKRRYSDTLEAPRHFIDLDYYESSLPLDTLPVKWKEAIAKYTEDTLKAYGIVPWHIQIMRFRLTEAFKQKDMEKILHYSADIGHYVADAHVPLHSTQNYNGQMTGQQGIHGFWESRLPELFSNGYDFYTGRAFYIDDVLSFAWAASEGSFAAKDSVLTFEANLNKSFPSDQKYIQEMKGQTQVKNYSIPYAEAYHTMLGNQVERRMRSSILAVGCIWYTCWVDAGQPDLTGIKPNKLSDSDRKKEVQEAQQLLQQKMIGRGE
jgi:hypothetical protein